MPELIDKNALRYIESDKDAYTQDWNDDYERGFRDAINKALKLPTIETEVRNGNGCSYCKGRAYSKKPLTVITRNMKRVETVFNFCPCCGRRMMKDAGTD